MIYLTAFCDTTIAATLSWMHSNHRNKWPAILYSLVFCVNGKCIRCEWGRSCRTSDKVARTNFVPKRDFPLPFTKNAFWFLRSILPESVRSIHSGKTAERLLQQCRRFHLQLKTRRKRSSRSTTYSAAKYFRYLDPTKQSKWTSSKTGIRLSLKSIETSALHLELRIFHFTWQPDNY